MTLNQLKFNLSDKNLNESDFKFLINDLLESKVMANGYVLNWKYTFKENVVFLEADLKKIK